MISGGVLELSSGAPAMAFFLPHLRVVGDKQVRVRGKEERRWNFPEFTAEAW